MRRDLLPRVVGIIAATPIAVGFFMLGAVVLVARSLREAIRGTPPEVTGFTNRGQTWGDEVREVEYPVTELRPTESGDEVASALRATATTTVLVDDVIRAFLSDARAFFVEHPDADTCEQIDMGMRKRAVATGKAVRVLMWPKGAAWDADPAVDQTFRAGEVP